MDREVAAFYDGLAADYHLLFDDWWEAARWHGAQVRAFLEAADVPPPARILDATCGIGTQAIPLAEAGYEVNAADLSADAVARARDESAARGVSLLAVVADVRELDRHVEGRFDAAISFDNALPHLVDPKDLVTALGAIRRCLAPGGIFLASIRDYDELRATRPTGVTPVTRGRPGHRSIVGQAWEWETDDLITIRLFLLKERTDGWTSTVHTTSYRAVTRAEMTSALEAAGYEDIVWSDPELSGYYQPVIAARAP